MASIAQSLPASSGHYRWLWGWLREELTPYPGRVLLVARMAIAATLVMIISMTFRLPYGAYGAYFALSLSRESVEASASAVRMIVIGFVLAGAYTFLGVMLVLGDPMLRFVWAVGTLFLIFYAISATNNYAASMRFGYLVVIIIPLWDRQIPADDKVEGTLWAIGTFIMASAIALVLEIAYAVLRRGDDLMDPLMERLACVEELLRLYAGGHPIDAAKQSRVTRQATVGTSRLRRLLQRSNKGPQYAQEMGAIVALTGRLTDLAANLLVLVDRVSDADRVRVGCIADRIAELSRDLKNGMVPRAAEPACETEAWPNLSLFGNIEKTVSLIAEVLSGSQSLTGFFPTAPGVGGRLPILAPGTLFKPDHVRFGLRGCLAASLCYITYNALFWPEISTAVTTCLLTALTTIGASHQKQVLRFGGAVIGGFVLGMGAQIFILPHIDSIAAFTVVFLVVAVFAAWIMTSSARLSYLGSQVAIAFFLINLQEFKIQTSLAVARDRVVGVLLGLLMMWLAFDQLWSAPAGAQMKRTFVASLRLLAQLAREPVSADLRIAIERSYSFRETINAQFDKVRSLADGVLFEFGPSRRRDLELRDRIRRWQPQLRTIFVLRIASWKYRAQLAGFELSESVRLLHEAYDDHSARMLEEMAGRIENNTSRPEETIERSHELLNAAVQEIQTEESSQLPSGRTQSFVTLLRGIDRLTTSLSSEIAAEFSAPPASSQLRHA
jgi:multidrug resistance protein MdtO